MVSLLHKRDAALAEAKAAALVLAVLHLFAFVVMMGYRIHTQRYYLSQAAIAEEFSSQLVLETSINATIIVSPKKKKKPKPKPKPKQPKVPETNPLERFEAPMQRLSYRLAEAHDLLQARTEDIRQQFQNLNTLDQTSKRLQQSLEEKEEELSDPGEKDTAQPESQHWRELLSLDSLRRLSDQEMSELFSSATREIMEIVRVANQDRKRGNQGIRRFVFDTGLGSGIAKEPSTLVCPIPSADASGTSANLVTSGEEERRRQLLDGAAYETDLENRLEEFEALFGNRIQANGIQALALESVWKLEKETEDKIWNVFDDIAGLADKMEEQLEQAQATTDEDAKTDRSSCIDHDLVSELITAGLNAQTAHTDVREALRKTIHELGALASEDELILDADLGSASNAGGNAHLGSSSRRMEPIHLRYMIDSPLLMKSIDWIDVLIDTIGGYNDELDSYLDSLTGFHGTTSVGEIVVEQLLEQAGRVGEIDAQRYLDRVQSKVQEIIGNK